MAAALIEHPAEPLPPPRPARTAVPPSATTTPADVAEADAPLAATPKPAANALETESIDGVPWPSDDAEVMARADAAERGETMKVTLPSAEEEEPVEKAATLPDLTQLVDRLPPQLKETLDDLFRARWVRVTRIKKRDLVS